MGAEPGGLNRWTRYFTVASALALVALQTAVLAGADRYALAALAVFGFVCPMVFGMAYLLLPSLVGRTLARQRLPGVHFPLAFVGAGCLVAYRFGVADRTTLVAGVVCWSLGVGLFLALLAETVVPAVRDRPEVVLRSSDLPQRSTRLATAAIPVALGYLAVGTVALLGSAGVVPAVLPAAFPRVVHYYTAGFGALLVFALGARLMPGFFHVTPPRRGTGVVLVAGAVGPGLLATFLWVDPWFRVGAVVEATAMAGYAAVVLFVFGESEWRRVSFDGILLGALAGVAAVAVGLAVAFGGATANGLAAHATLVLSGFFPLTIVGYAYQFFPVTTGQFPGASERTARATIWCLAVGVTLQSVGRLWALPAVVDAGAVVALVGAAGYAYLLGRRLL